MQPFRRGARGGLAARWAWAALAVAIVGTGCYSNPPTPITNVGIYWDFVRHKADGTTVVYDASPTATATGVCPDGSLGCGPCAESGVDFVVLTRGDGAPVDPDRPSMPCTYDGLHGATVLQVPIGPQTFRVTGYRRLGGGTSVALYAGEVAIDVVGGYYTETTVHAAGIRQDLAVAVTFANAAGSPIGNTCPAGELSLLHRLVDSAGTVVAEGPMGSCSPAGISYLGSQGIDRDRYTIRVQAFPSASPAPGDLPDYDSASTAAAPPGQPTCSQQPFDHYADDTGAAAWAATAYDVTASASRCP